MRRSRRECGSLCYPSRIGEQVERVERATCRSCRGNKHDGGFIRWLEALFFEGEKKRSEIPAHRTSSRGRCWLLLFLYS
jgi:hypothetical protein